MAQEQTRAPRAPKYHEVSAAPVADVAAVAGEAPAQRPARKPFGALEQKLNYPAREGFHRHWFNDTPGRVARAQAAGYEHVKDHEGKNVNRIVGTAEGGGAQTAFLMETPEEWFQEDMNKQQEAVDAREEAMRRGKLDDQLGDKGYVPAQGISIKRAAQ